MGTSLTRKTLADFTEFTYTCKGWHVVLRPNPKNRVTPYSTAIFERCYGTCEGNTGICLANEPWPISREVCLAVQLNKPVKCHLRSNYMQTACIMNHFELEFISPPTKEELYARLISACKFGVTNEKKRNHIRL